MASCKTDFLCTLNEYIISYVPLALLGRGIRPFMLIFGTLKAMKKFTSTKCWSRKDSLTKLTTPWAIPGISRHPLRSTHTRQSDFRGEITAGFVSSAMESTLEDFSFGHACGVCHHSCCVARYLQQTLLLGNAIVGFKYCILRDMVLHSRTLIQLRDLRKDGISRIYVEICWWKLIGA